MRKICGMLLYVFVMLSMLSAGHFRASAETGPVPVRPVTGGECTVHIDLDTLKMSVYLDMELYKTFPVSGGTPETPSPVGTWLVTEVLNWGEGFGGTWIGLDVPWGRYGIHGTRKPWLVGQKNVSHGCIRMKNGDVDELRGLVSPGTVVHIKHDALPWRNIGRDSKGSNVYEVQIMLGDMGFYTGAIDGICGGGMVRAIKGFQRTYSLVPDGVVRKSTYEIIVREHDLFTARG